MSEPKAPALCIPRSRVEAVLGDLQGYRGTPEIDPDDTLRDLTAIACQFLPREPTPRTMEISGRLLAMCDQHGKQFEYSCESDPSHKQLIPYLILMRDGKLLIYERGTSGGEDRLHTRRSCGLGGHVEECDWRQCRTRRGAIRRAAWRELEEEVGAAKELCELRFVGFVNDDSDAVGRVHLGLVYMVHVLSCADLRFAPEIVNPQWVDPSEVDASEFEGWSRMILDAIREGRLT